MTTIAEQALDILTGDGPAEERIDRTVNMLTKALELGLETERINEIVTDPEFQAWYNDRPETQEMIARIQQGGKQMVYPTDGSAPYLLDYDTVESCDEPPPGWKSWKGRQDHAL